MVELEADGYERGQEPGRRDRVRADADLLPVAPRTRSRPSTSRTRTSAGSTSSSRDWSAGSDVARERAGRDLPRQRLRPAPLTSSAGVTAPPSRPRRLPRSCGRRRRPARLRRNARGDRRAPGARRGRADGVARRARGARPAVPARRHPHRPPSSEEIDGAARGGAGGPRCSACTDSRASVPMELPRLDARRRAGTAAALVAGAWVEDKGGSLAVHYRQAADPDTARAIAARGSRPRRGNGRARDDRGQDGDRARSAGRPLKGGAVERLDRRARAPRAPVRRRRPRRPRRVRRARPSARARRGRRSRSRSAGPRRRRS